jgi:CubicO group peptidase (beta-lactamase class C family)
MRPRLFTHVLVLVLASLVSGVQAADFSRSDLNRSDFSTQTLEKLIDPIAKKNLEENTGSVITIVHAGQVVFNKGYGNANLETKKMVDPNKTLFRVGSISKTFTAIAVMQLLEQGKLELDADINTYLKVFKVVSPFGKPITMRHLLTHTAGFQESSHKLFFDRPEDMKSLEQSLAAYLPKLVRPPGEASMYSNHGITLAGYIVEVISGEPYAQYVQRHILGPLRMTHSSAMQPLPATLAPDVATGYDANDPKKPLAKHFELIEIAPAGAISATGTDMARYMQMLLNGGELDGQRILKASTLETMFGPQWRLQPGAVGMGFVFWRELFGDQLAISHGGDTQWFHSSMRFFPAQKLGVFVSVNSTGGSLRRDLNRAMLKAYFPTKIPKVSGAIQPRALQNIAGGTYRNLRMEDDKFTKIMGLIQIHPKDLGNGQLELQGSVIPGQNLTLVQTAPLVYRVAKSPNEFDVGNESFSFSNDGKYMMQDSDYSAYQRVPPLENDDLHLGLLALGLLCSLGVLFGAIYRVARSVIRKARKLPPVPARPAWTGVLAFSSAVAFVLTVALAVMGLAQFMAEPPPILYLAATCSILAALLTVGLIVTSVQAWRNRWWNTFTRVRYSILTFACVGMVFFLNTWNLLGFHF